jgi:sigma-B regulation protein RsbU (phosphoserine phosphatase)
MEEPILQLDHQGLYRRLDSLFKTLDCGQPQVELLKSFLEESHRTLGEHLGLKASLYYQERGESFQLEKVAGDAGKPAQTLPTTAPPLEILFRHRVYVFSDPYSEISPCHCVSAPVCAAAAVVVGKQPDRSVLFYFLDPGAVREELDFTLSSIRAALGVRLLEQRLQGSFREAAAIQQSLLLEEPPAFAGFDIACRTVPAEEVGGDFYDFYSFANQVLGVAIGDASGHGLPAALLVRDVVTGLRMGVEKHLKIASVFEKLNRVIHQSRLSSRFVSLVYVELESTGNMIYVNAGHHPPLLIHKSTTEPLEIGGSVIGPLPEVAFQRSITRMHSGSILALCTDGLLERRNAQDEFFGEHRLESLMRECAGLPAEAVVERLFASAFDYGGGRPWEDDATAVIVIRK